jgi:hypothetical protein
MCTPVILACTVLARRCTNEAVDLKSDLNGILMQDIEWQMIDRLGSHMYSNDLSNTKK